MNNKKKYIPLACFLAAALCFSTGCRNRRHRPAGPAWNLHIPSSWLLHKQGRKGPDMTYAVYKRIPLYDKEKNKIVPSCVITSEDMTGETDIARYALDRQSRIIASMQKKGYRLAGFRRDIQQQIKTAFRMNSIVSLSYEYEYRKNGRTYLTITVFAKKKEKLLNLTIESTAGTYEVLRKEIYCIISSIR